MGAISKSLSFVYYCMVLYVINCLCSNDTCNHWDTERPKVPVKLGNMEEVSALSVCDGLQSNCHVHPHSHIMHYLLPKY